MLFDERRRAELLKKYDALPETERKLCRFLAVVYVPTDKKVRQVWANVSGCE